MNPNFLKFTAFLLLLTGIASSCNPECPPDCPDEYPQNISFTEYSLNETSCQWQNLPYDEKVVIINSNEELEKYISCTEGGYPVIDFSKHSLLLASGKTDYGICEITAKSLQQLSPDKYELHIEITLSDTTDIKEWAMALIVKKLNKKDKVKLNITLNINYPIEVPFTELELETQCQWINLNYPEYIYDAELIIVNNNEELKNYISCSDENYPEIDFSKHTLLLANGGPTPRNVMGISKHLLQFSTNKYKLDIKMHFGDGGWGRRWVIALIVNKMNEESDVELNVIFINFD